MRLLRAILVAVCAAVAGDMTAAGLLWGSLDHWQIALFPFGILGALLLPTAFGWVREAGYSRTLAYLCVALLGPVAGWLMLLGSGVGACYGALTAAYWIAFNVAVEEFGQRLFRAAGAKAAARSGILFRTRGQP